MDSRLFNALVEFVHGKFDEFGTPPNPDPESDRIDATNPFVFSRFCCYVAAHRFDIPLLSYDQAYTDGDGDRGLDGVMIAVGGEPLAGEESAAFELVRDLLAQPQVANRVMLPRIVFVQAKGTLLADLADLSHFMHSAKDFLVRSDYDALVPNDRVRNWRGLLHGARRAYMDAGIEFNPRIDLVFTYTGEFEETNAFIGGRRRSCEEDLRLLLPWKDVHFHVWGATELIRHADKARIAADGVINDAELLPLPGNSAKGFIGYVPAKALVDVLPVYTNSRDVSFPDEKIFTDNVRSFLASAHQSETDLTKYSPGGAGLQKSLRDGEAGEVVLRHNGITIVARKVDYDPGSHSLRLEGYQIVNGAQTAHILFQNSSVLEGAFIPIKAVEVNDDHRRAGIILGANTHAALDSFDMIAVFQEVRDLQLAFDATGWKRPDKLWLVRRRGERLKAVIDDQDRILSLRDLLGGFVSTMQARPHAVTERGVPAFTGLVPSDIFNGNHDPEVYRAIGWLVVAGRKWAKLRGYSWPNASSRWEAKGGYKPRHHFTFALWLLLNPDLRGPLDASELQRYERFKAIIEILGQPNELRRLGEKAGQIVELLAKRVNPDHKAFTDAIIENVLLDRRA